MRLITVCQFESWLFLAEIWHLVMQVNYLCRRPGHVAVDLRVWSEAHSNQSVLFASWPCTPHVIPDLHRSVIVHLPTAYANKPHWTQRETYTAHKAVLYLYLVARERVHSQFDVIPKSVFAFSQHRVKVRENFPSFCNLFERNVWNNWLDFTTLVSIECKFDETLRQLVDAHAHVSNVSTDMRTRTKWVRYRF